jgi:hypothetical protein
MTPVHTGPAIRALSGFGRRLIAVTGAATVFLSTASVVTAESRDSVERTLLAQQAPPGAPAGATTGDVSAKTTNATSNRRQTLHRSRRPHMRAMPQGMSDRQMQLRQQQEKAR